MSHLFSLLPTGGWQRLLCDALWQSTLIGALGLLAAHFFVRQSAARAWLLLLALSACLLAPVASWAARQMQWTILNAQPQGVTALAAVAIAPPPIAATQIAVSPISAPHEAMLHEQSPNAEALQPDDSQLDAAQNVVAHPTIVQELPPVDVAAMPRRADVHLPLGPPVEPGAKSDKQMESSAARSPLIGLGIAWLAAASLLALRLAISTLATRRLLRRAMPCNDAQLLAAASVAAQRVSLSGLPRILISPQVHTPMILALGRPQLLIPATYSRNSQKIDWVAAFTHELAHAARHDGWARLWIELVTIASPLQPLVWMLRHRFQITSEEACDDWAVATGTDPVDLADALAAWINVPRRSPTLAAIGMSSSKARTLRLLALREKPAARLGRAWRWLGIPVALVLMAGLAVAQSPTGKSNVGGDSAKSAPPKKAVGEQSSTRANASPVNSKAASSPPDDLVDKAIADDPLIGIYSQRLAEDHKELADMEADKKSSDDDKANMRSDIKSFEDRIETRKAAVREQLAEQLPGAAGGHCIRQRPWHERGGLCD